MIYQVEEGHPVPALCCCLEHVFTSYLIKRGQGPLPNLKIC